MAATEENSPVPYVSKGKRTARQRLLTLSPPPPATSSSSSVDNSGRSAEELEEEEDLANCLILLARGHSVSHPLETAAAVPEKLMKAKDSGGFGYECKTCSKCFSSFQALGGHRTSHKKSKPVLTSESIQLSMNSFSGVGKAARVHECSICGSEFASGQALGGHMRRHRPLNLPEPVETKKGRTNIVLSLDLNLPAPAEDCICSSGDLPASTADDVDGGGGFSFGSNQPLLLPRSLIDCQY